MNFVDLGLAPEFVERLQKKGISTPSPIQAEVFPAIVDGKSVLGFAKTGTGKTFAYVLPLIQRMHSQVLGNAEFAKPGIRTIVLVPTRELATQVFRDLELITGSEATGVVIVGGESDEDQIRRSNQASWIIATPGRLLDLLRRRAVDVSRVHALVFDEADRLLDMGFVDDMRAIVKFLPKEQAQSLQMLFFSATMHFGIDEMAYEFGANEVLRFGKETDELTVEGLDHRISFVGDQEKLHALAHLVFEQGTGRGIVFSNYRERAHEVAYRLKTLGCEAEVLTAQLTQAARTKIMERFREGKTRILVASDLAARGLDIFDIDFVVNLDLPEDPATYVHRVGRTARAGRKGVAYSFVGFEDAFRLERLEKFLGKSIVRHPFPVEQLQGTLPRLGDAVAPTRLEMDRDRGDLGDQGSRHSGPRGNDRGPRRDAPGESGRGHRSLEGRSPHSHRQDRPRTQGAASQAAFHSAQARVPGPEAPRQARTPGGVVGGAQHTQRLPALRSAAPQVTIWGRLWNFVRSIFGKGSNTSGSSKSDVHSKSSKPTSDVVGGRSGGGSRGGSDHRRGSGRGGRGGPSRGGDRSSRRPRPAGPRGPRPPRPSGS